MRPVERIPDRAAHNAADEAHARGDADQDRRPHRIERLDPGVMK